MDFFKVLRIFLRGKDLFLNPPGPLVKGELHQR
jgi:hypothetical protein